MHWPAVYRHNISLLDFWQPVGWITPSPSSSFFNKTSGQTQQCLRCYPWYGIQDATDTTLIIRVELSIISARAFSSKLCTCASEAATPTFACTASSIVHQHSTDGANRSLLGNGRCHGNKSGIREFCQ